MTERNDGHELVDYLAEEFALRLRNGERPTVEEYAERYPNWAEDLRAVLPGVALMEQFRPQPEEQQIADSLPSSRSPPPERLGEYRILREIGRGGMGVVYEAEQPALGRRVAIKVLPRHLLTDEKLRLRFRRESQAAARLHHTNIVPVFAVEESGDLCFYVMQLIDGRGLDQVIYADTIARGSDSAPANLPCTARLQEPPQASVNPPRVAADRTSPRLPALAEPVPRESFRETGDSVFCRTVAKIGLQVADALTYAHAQGVLHRDIKPSNLLLDAAGNVWVTDFGVAKLVEEAGLTRSDEFVGTLKYMPPERFAGHSDARGDVYSLGVTLYELLTRQPAFPDTNPQHLIQLITHEAPVRPRKLNPLIPTDLETIVLKAATRDRAHRYQTAQELAEDLRRFLDDRPIKARRAGPMEQTWRWCRRNPALASATAAACLLMLTVTVVSLVAYTKTAQASRAIAAANRDMEIALAAETVQREHAESASMLALDALNRVYDRFAPTRLVAIPQVLNGQGVPLPPQPALPPEAVAFMEDLLRTYEQIARSAGEFPKLQAQAAVANHRIGDIRQRLGRNVEAAAAYRAAIGIYQTIALSNGESVCIPQARACNELGRTLRVLQQFDEADRVYERAMQTLDEAPEKVAERPEWRYEMARASFMFGQREPFVAPRGRPPDRPPPRNGRPRGFDPRPPAPPPDGTPGPPGGHPARRAADLLEQLVHEFPKVPEYRHLLACCYRDIPPERPRPGEPPGKSNRDRAIALLRQLVKDFPEVPDYRLDLCETLARSHPQEHFEGENDESERHIQLEEAVALSAPMVANYQNVPEYAAAHARYLARLGASFLHMATTDEAEKLLLKALTTQQRLAKQYPEVIAHAFGLSLTECYLGELLTDRGDWKGARARLEAAVDRLETLRKKDLRLEAVRPFLAMAYRDLAKALTGGGEKLLASEANSKAQEHSSHDPFKPRDRGGPPPRER